MVPATRPISNGYKCLKYLRCVYICLCIYLASTTRRKRYTASHIEIHVLHLTILIAQPGIEPQTFALPGLHATTQPRLFLCCSCQISILTLLVFCFRKIRLLGQPGIELQTFALPGLHSTTHPQLSSSYSC